MGSIFRNIQYRSGMDRRLAGNARNHMDHLMDAQTAIVIAIGAATAAAIAVKTVRFFVRRKKGGRTSCCGCGHKGCGDCKDRRKP